MWSRDWERLRLDGAQMLRLAIRAAVIEKERADWGELAGETVMDLAHERGLETTSHDIYGSVAHHACLADILASAIRRPSEPSWTLPEPIALPGGAVWQSSCFLSPTGSHLRRVVLVTAWGDDRHYAECRSWGALGEVCAYDLPMKQAILVLGPHRDGRRHSPWTKGLLHPSNKKLRFKRKNSTLEGFKETWERVWREDHAEIDRSTWLQTMLDDDILRDVCFNVEIPVPGQAERQEILGLAERKLDAVMRLRELPDRQMSTCDWPLPCVFKSDCHAGLQPRAGKFIPLL